MQVNTDVPVVRTAVICYFVMGMGFLAPWNAFLTAIDYFSSLYVGLIMCMVSYLVLPSHGSFVFFFQGGHMDRLFTACYLPICLYTLVIMMRYGPGGSRGPSLFEPLTSLTERFLNTYRCD